MKVERSAAAGIMIGLGFNLLCFVGWIGLLLVAVGSAAVLCECWLAGRASWAQIYVEEPIEDRFRFPVVADRRETWRVDDGFVGEAAPLPVCPRRA